MKRVESILVTLLLPLMLMAQGHGFQLAPRGGATTWLSNDVTTQWTPQAGLELSYLVRWRVKSQVQVGMRTGLAATYTRNQLSAQISSEFDRTDALHNPIHYTTTASAKEQHYQVGVELPVLFAMQAKGVTLNIGPKLLWMAYDRYQQTVDDAHIDAWYTQWGVHVQDQPATGLLQTPYTQWGSGSLPKLNLLLSAEIGYEWSVGPRYSKRNEQYVGVQLYVDYGLWSLQPTKNEAFLSVTPIQQTSADPQITMGPIQSTNALNYVSAGIRLYYTIQTVDYPGHGWHRWR